MELKVIFHLPKASNVIGKKFLLKVELSAISGTYQSIAHGFNLCQMTPLEPPFPLSWTLTLGWKNKKQLFGPIELDIEAGNLVFG